ncbi:uncharacterized protein LOC126980600 isoform X2 [Eriocheir sinensis]|uniref:uncharacterized protein LOC126980600 isoform X2 n=1 Tax=Eriocheir sinensis TaxID=95602 RepID=UPI0021C79CBD|nr:uncharacterized protein LOC126980600 isoform X2 [Eriocheir sinensis]
MDTYKLLDISGSDSGENIQITPLTQIQQPPQRKKRLKRRERDLLRMSPSQFDEESGRLCSCVTIGVGGEGCRPTHTTTGEAVRSALLVLALTGLTLLTWLTLHLQSRLDSTQHIISSFEASSSELPAKFHQSHVRLQELEKNQSALWAAVNQLTSSLDAAAKRLEVLEGGVKGIRDSLNTSPQLSSLPKDVAALQGSVATFGSTLQDVHSSLENIKKDHDTLTSSVKSSASSIDRLKEDISQLHNDTALRRTSDGAAPATVGEGVVDLQEKVETVTTAITAINTTFAQQTSLATTTTRKLESLEESSAVVRANLTQQVSYLDRWRNTVLPALTSQVTNLTSAVASLQQTSNMLEERVLNLTQVMDVVKGVEKRLEGSQVQLASSVSELKQHLDKVEKKVSTIKAAAEAAAAAAAAATPPSIAPPTKHTATTRD